MEQLIGKTLGQYQIVQELGRGGMAVVYKAHQPALQRHVAIKVLPPQMGTDPGFVKRFQQEAVAAAKLKHPHIVTIYDVGITDGVNYIVMEFIEGRPLSAVIRQSGAMPPERVAHIIGQVASALDYAHQQGFVHRDIKPSNVMKTGIQERPFVLLDLGIAYAVHETGLTYRPQERMPLATYRYLAPEMMRPDFRSRIDYRTDLYTIGMTVYEYAAGRHPLARDADDLMQTISRAMRHPPTPLAQHRPDLPPEFHDLVDGMLKKNPALRPANLRILFRKLEGMG